MGFIRRGDAAILRSPRGMCGFVKASEHAAGDGLLPIGRTGRSRETSGFPVHSGARSANCPLHFERPCRYLKSSQQSIRQPPANRIN
jgi:hypothetical protein